MIDPIHAFYCSAAWRGLSYMLRIRSGGVCADCGRVYQLEELRPHHIIELTIANINDTAITLNPDNIKVVCADCHNRAEHNRFGGARAQRVYLVYGAPLAGKTSYVATVATRHDIVIDFDRLHEAITVCQRYDKPDDTKSDAFAIYDLLLDRIRVRAGKWQDAYVIGCFPSRGDRDRFVREYYAEAIHVDTPRDECIRRAKAGDRPIAVADAQLRYIDDYFSRFHE